MPNLLHRQRPGADRATEKRGYLALLSRTLDSNIGDRSCGSQPVRMTCPMRPPRHVATYCAPSLPHVFFPKSHQIKHLHRRKSHVATWQHVMGVSCQVWGVCCTGGEAARCRGDKPMKILRAVAEPLPRQAGHPLTPAGPKCSAMSQDGGELFLHQARSVSAP
jgi:hypothetical protein